MKRSRVGVAIILVLFAIAIPSYLTRYTSPDPDHSNSKQQAESPVNRSDETLAPIADAPPPTVSQQSAQPTIRPTTQPLPAQQPLPEPYVATDLTDIVYASSCSAADPLEPTVAASVEGRQGNVLTVGTIAPSHSQHTKGLIAAAKEIERRTGGRVIVKTRTSSYQLLRRIRSRQFQGGVFTPAELYSVYPDLGIYSLPGIFRSQAEVAYVRERMDAKLHVGLRDAGFVSFCFAGTGFTTLMSNRPLRNHVDLQSVRLWVPEGDPVLLSAAQALGMSTHALPLSDVLVGIQTDLLDALFATPIGALIMQWHTKVRYLTSLSSAYSFNLLVMEKNAFEALAPQDQLIVQQVFDSLFANFDRTGHPDSAEALNALIRSGIQVVDADPGVAAAIDATLKKEYLRMADAGVFSKELYLELLGHVEAYRASQNN